MMTPLRLVSVEVLDPILLVEGVDRQHIKTISWILSTQITLVVGPREEDQTLKV